VLLKTAENANSYNSLTLNEERVDVQGTKEDRNTSQQQPTATNNTVF
jgi:hypothetical protein